VADVKEIMCTCEGYQLFKNQAHVPVAQIQTIPLDIVETFMSTKGAVAYLFMTFDKFTKIIISSPHFQNFPLQIYFLDATKHSPYLPLEVQYRLNFLWVENFIKKTFWHKTF
jgi:hypothetical protein